MSSKTSCGQSGEYEEAEAPARPRRDTPATLTLVHDQFICIVGHKNADFLYTECLHFKAYFKCGLKDCGNEIPRGAAFGYISWHRKKEKKQEYKETMR